MHRLLLTLIIGSVIGAGAFAGPITPPPGPVASTYRTLAEVEPRIAINATNTPGDADSLFKITQPGSYYLTGNITGIAGKHGIEIVASGVTLDMNGFDLGGTGGTSVFDGVSITVNGLNNIAVVNGSVRNWGAEGVDLGTRNVSNCRVEDVLASRNGGSGITTGPSSTISNCSAFDSGGSGITTGRGNTVWNCTAYQNTGSGITTGTSSTVTNCAVYENAADGISTGAGSTVLNCAAYDNTGNGISVEFGSLVSNCSAYLNSGNGISTTNSSTVADCTARSNTLDGIRCSSGCLIRGSTCSFNGSLTGDGAGIHATGSDNRIEGNNCNSADRGIDVDAAGNIIIRNTCSGNTTNWDVVADNVILVINAATAAAVNGNSGGTAPGSTDPNANFTY